jgi:L-glyceraldehyde 3-phosphate reductase
MALAWVLRDDRVSSALIGVRSLDQLEDSLGVVARLEFEPEELAEIESLAIDGALNVWARSSST